MVYVIAALGLPTIGCLIHAATHDDKESVRGGLVFLGLTMLVGLLLLPFIGID
jgi:hypothetical protein